MLAARDRYRQGTGRISLGRSVAAGILLFLACLAAYSQSTQQDFPTPITSNQIVGEIAARRVGDSRTTTYFYTFKGETGDTFINVLTDNFAGDIDVIVVDGLRLLSRMVVLADTEPSETGRVIYLRKPETLLLRINGRSPNDDPAKFQVKFAGSFVAISDDKATPVPELPVVPKPVFAETIASERKSETQDGVSADRTVADTDKDEAEPQVDSKPLNEATTRKETKAAGKTAAVPPKSQDRPASRATVRTTRPGPPVISKTETIAKEPPKTEKPAEVDPMAQFRLVIVFKDGSKIDRPMTEVLRFTVDKGVLTVIGKDGRIGRYSMGEVQRVGIE